MTKLKAVLFDLDGVIRDSREVIFPAYEHTLNTHVGKTPSRELLVPYVHHEDAVHNAFASEVPQKAFVTTYHNKIEELRPNMKLYDDANTVLKALKDTGYKLGLVSHATTATEFLTSHGLIGYFSAILDGNQDIERKPSPAPVLQALDMLKVAPEDAVMIGDLPSDIKSAAGAGLRISVGITHGFGNEKILKEAGAGYIIDSLIEIIGVIKEIEAS